MSSVLPVPLPGLTATGAIGAEVGTGRNLSAARAPGGSIVATGRRSPAGPGRAGAPVLIVGAVGTEPGALLEALVMDPDLNPRDPETRQLRRGGLAAVTGGPALAVLRHGSVRRANAFLPGRRQPVPIDLGFLGALGELPRPARRLEIEYPSELLKSVGLAGAPELTDLDRAGCDVVLDVVDRAAGVVFLTGSAAFEQCHLELFDAMTSRASRLAFVTAPSAGRGHAPALAAKRALLMARDPVLAAAPWFSAGDWAELRQLRGLILEWGAARAASRSLVMVPGQRLGRGIAPRVATESGGWRQILEQDTATRRNSAGSAVTTELAATLSRCSRLLGSSTRGDVIPRMLDRELQALSVRLTRRLERDAAELSREVCTALLGADPEPELVDRVLRSAGQAIESFDDAPAPHGMLLTMTGAVATIAGEPALGAMAALSPQGNVGLSAAPLALAVSQTCFRESRWASDNGAERCLAWLRRALTAVGGEVLRDLDSRYADLRRGLELVAEEAVDHGFLLV